MYDNVGAGDVLDGDADPDRATSFHPRRVGVTESLVDESAASVACTEVADEPHVDPAVGHKSALMSGTGPAGTALPYVGPSRGET